VLVTPEQPAAQQEQHRQYRELGAGDAPLAPVAVVPGDHEDYRQADGQTESRKLLDLARPIEYRPTSCE